MLRTKLRHRLRLEHLERRTVLAADIAALAQGADAADAPLMASDQMVLCSNGTDHSDSMPNDDGTDDQGSGNFGVTSIDNNSGETSGSNPQNSSDDGDTMTDTSVEESTGADSGSNTTDNNGLLSGLNLSISISVHAGVEGSAVAKSVSQSDTLGGVDVDVNGDTLHINVSDLQVTGGIGLNSFSLTLGGFHLSAVNDLDVDFSTSANGFSFSLTIGAGGATGTDSTDAGDSSGSGDTDATEGDSSGDMAGSGTSNSTETGDTPDADNGSNAAGDSVSGGTGDTTADNSATNGDAGSNGGVANGDMTGGVDSGSGDASIGDAGSNLGTGATTDADNGATLDNGNDTIGDSTNATNGAIDDGMIDSTDDLSDDISGSTTDLNNNPGDVGVTTTGDDVSVGDTMLPGTDFDDSLIGGDAMANDPGDTGLDPSALTPDVADDTSIAIQANDTGAAITDAFASEIATSDIANGVGVGNVGPSTATFDDGTMGAADLTNGGTNPFDVIFNDLGRNDPAFV